LEMSRAQMLSHVWISVAPVKRSPIAESTCGRE
jgi:hypothetical protein